MNKRVPMLVASALCIALGVAFLPGRQPGASHAARESGTGNWEPGTGNRELGTGNREPGTGNREPGTVGGARNVAPFRAPSPSTAQPSQRAAPDLVDADFDDEDDDLTPAERALARRIESAMDEENLAAAIECSRSALDCPNAEVRQSMVDALGWFGAKALPELTPFLADPDPSVRESAQNEWSVALSGLEDEAEKIGVVEAAMTVLNDEEALEDISGEYIGVDEKVAVESLLRIIESGGRARGIEKAKETYSFVTGEDFTSRAEAERWLSEEYEPQ